MRSYEQKDYTTVKKWIGDRGFNIPDREDIPSVGIIEDDVACGFLILTDVNVGIIDFFVSNPKAKPIEAGKALDHITHALVQKAKSLGLSRVECSTKKDSIVKLAQKHNFRTMGHYTILSVEL